MTLRTILSRLEKLENQIDPKVAPILEIDTLTFKDGIRTVLTLEQIDEKIRAYEATYPGKIHIVFVFEPSPLVPIESCNLDKTTGDIEN